MDRSLIAAVRKEDDAVQTVSNVVIRWTERRFTSSCWSSTGWHTASSIKRSEQWLGLRIMKVRLEVSYSRNGFEPHKDHKGGYMTYQTTMTMALENIKVRHGRKVDRRKGTRNGNISIVRNLIREWMSEETAYGRSSFLPWASIDLCLNSKKLSCKRHLESAPYGSNKDFFGQILHNYYIVEQLLNIAPHVVDPIVCQRVVRSIVGNGLVFHFALQSASRIATTFGNWG